MSLDEKFVPIRTAFYTIIGNFFEKVAESYGYPDNPGLPTIRPFFGDLDYRAEFLETLPVHTTNWPPLQRPETLFEMIFGPSPKVDTIPRYIYENKEEGFYNFYVENYKNLYFLPDWISHFIQVKLNICLDITVLEIIREVIFLGLAIYFQIMVIRLALSWIISINPYTSPWCYIIASVDWTEDLLQGIVPSVFGVNITGTVFLGMLGIVADSLNHLVFTMPFLPSEGEETKLLINQQMKDVLVFHYLPILWYRYPIPNDIREFWYKERPDILDYMQKAYKDLDIQVLPDTVIRELNQKMVVMNLFFNPTNLVHMDISSNQSILSELLSKIHLIQTNILFSPIHLQISIMAYFERLF